MRGAIEGLNTPHALGAALPALYQEDDFAMRLVSVFDDALSPVFSVLDNLDAYLDPLQTPEDFLEWLAGWVGLALDDSWPIGRRRELVARALFLYRWRGTARGLAELVSIYTGVTPEIEESGGSNWSSSPRDPMPGRSEPAVTVRLRVADPAGMDRGRLDAIVVAAKPAHVPHSIEIESL